MRTRLPILAGGTVVLVLLLAAGCSGGRDASFASMGATPPMSLAPIGPVPGPGGNTHQPAMTNPFAHDASALVQGRRLFVRYNCYGCHGGHAGGGMGPSLRDSDWIYGSTAADIFSSIAQGRAHGMPAWGTRLPQDQIWMLVTYIKSLRTSREPSPPTPAPAHAPDNAAAQVE